ncbi:MAG: AsmA family protein, partial [Xanthobacteraceae bacterium]
VSANTADEFALPFTVQGPWDSPVPLPDASSLIRHSNAAAPLLEAVKRHSAGDAVRSVIDQLFAPPAAAPVASKPATAPAASEYKPAAVTAPATSQ